MFHAVALLGQMLPYVEPVYRVAVPADPARARTLTVSDWAVIAAATTPMCTMAISLLRRYRKYDHVLRSIDGVRPAPEPLVWVNTESGIYYVIGQRWYGKTRNGMLLTRGLAERRGNRPAKNTLARQS